MKVSETDGPSGIAACIRRAPSRILSTSPEFGCMITMSGAMHNKKAQVKKHTTSCACSRVSHGWLLQVSRTIGGLSTTAPCDAAVCKDVDLRWHHPPSGTSKSVSMVSVM